jgi:uncharacterized membrane protein (UPF0127 family)
MKLKCLILFLMPLCLFADSFLNLRVCKTSDEMRFGLMNCLNLPENEGMLFTYDKDDYRSLWMFNCYIDLSAAFIDEKGVIKEIREMKAFPEMMDKNRPVNNVKDIDQYPYDDPITQFYSLNTTHSHVKAKYIIEANSGWFTRHKIQVGSKVLFENNQAVFQDS